MKLPKNIVSIKLPSKKNKTKLDATDESEINTKLYINNKTINVQDKDNIPKQFTLTKQKNNEIKTIKNKEKYSERIGKLWLGRTYDYNYVNSNNSKPSLPCPAPGCTCGVFSKIVDHYDNDIYKN